MSQTIETTNPAPTEDAVPKNMTGYLADRKNRIAAVIMAALAGALFTLLIIEHNIGINYFVFAFSLIASAGFVMYKDDNLNVAKYAFWALAFLAYASFFFRLQNKAFTVLTIMALPPLFVLATVFSAQKLPQNIVVNAIIRFFGSIAFVDKIFIALKSLTAGKKGKDKSAAIKIIAGIAVSFVLLLIIVPLMFSADALFKKVIVDIVDLTKISEILWKTVLSAVVAILFFGFLYIITVKKDVPSQKMKQLIREYNIESVLIVVLCVVGAAYLAFAAIQYGYLFGSLRDGLPRGLSITEYARRGYFEQVAMTVINVVIIGLAVLFTEKSSGRLKTAINVLLIYFIAVNFYLMVSSAYKMHLYQKVYGFTVLRLLVDILLVFESLALIMLAVKVLKRKIKYLMFLIYFTVAFWAVVSFINIEGLAADLNIKRYEKEGKIDIENMVRMDDVSGQLKYLYLNHYDSLESGDIEKIEQYFLNDARNNYMYEADEVTNLDKPIEFNISRDKRAKDANEILRSKNPVTKHN